MRKGNKERNQNTHLTLEVPENLPADLLSDHQLLQVRSVLVPNPKERCDNVNFRPRLGGHVLRAKSEVQILHEEQDVRGELDSFAETDTGGVFAGNRDQKGRNLSPVGIPKKKKKGKNR